MMQNQTCPFGTFDKDRLGAYTITEIPSSAWEYILQNRDVLLRVDQFGVVNAQARPPEGILLVRRGDGERYSPWQIWVRCSETGQTVSAFGFPRGERPLSHTVDYAPERVQYVCRYDGFTVTATLSVPRKGVALLCEVRIHNTSDRDLHFTVTTAIEPWCTKAVMAPWDKPEWYLCTGIGLQSGTVTFFTKQNTPTGAAENRRGVCFAAGGAGSAETDRLAFTGTGSFDCPDAVFGPGGEKPLAQSFEQLGQAGATDGNTVYGYPPVYAYRCAIAVNAGKEYVKGQVLHMQSESAKGVYDPAEAISFARFVDPEVQEAERERQRAFYKQLFSCRTLSTGDSMFDGYLNGFLPLQMYWVASLDRGWPTGMRGVRDAANDFMGMLLYDPAWARQVLLELFACQQKNGWLPRQISTAGPQGTHDMRAYCDGGAFALEFLYEYISETADRTVLDEPLRWLDDEHTEPLYTHFLRAVDYYIAAENLGEHGLCKIYAGDWLDAVNQAGLQGRGESVMVSCQTVMNLGYADEILAFYGGAEAEKERRQTYRTAAQALKNAIRSAYNGAGFFNSVFTDGGRWVFSDCDEDGACRMYGPANYYAICCGAADEKMRESVLRTAQNLRCESGWRLFAPGFSGYPMHNVGRIASGDMPDGLWENGNVYNHGSQGFLARALAACGKGDLLREVITYMLPYDQTAHPVVDTQSAPYAVVNCWQRLPRARHRGGMPFLTGTIAMALRAVHRWMLGLVPTWDGLVINPCLPTGKTEIKTQFTLRGKMVTVRYSGRNTGKTPLVRIGKHTAAGVRADKKGVFIPEVDLCDGAVITVAMQ